MQMKFYSPLTADFFPNEPDCEDEIYNEYEGYPMDGHELLAIRRRYPTMPSKRISQTFNGDLMQYYREDDSVRQQGGKCRPVCGDSR